MGASFFEQPILNSPYEAPRLHHALDEHGQPLDVPPVEGRRRSEIITPVPMPRMQTGRTRQGSLALGDVDDPSVGGQEYNPTPIINEIRNHVASWRALAQPGRLGGYADDGAALGALAFASVLGRPALLLSDRGGGNRHLADGGALAAATVPHDPRASRKRQRRIEPRTLPPRNEDGDGGRQDDRHGDADRLAHRERRARVGKQPLQQGISRSSRLASQSATACAS